MVKMQLEEKDSTIVSGYLETFWGNEKKFENRDNRSSA